MSNRTAVSRKLEQLMQILWRWRRVSIVEHSLFWRFMVHSFGICFKHSKLHFLSFNLANSRPTSSSDALVHVLIRFWDFITFHIYYIVQDLQIQTPRALEHHAFLFKWMGIPIQVFKPVGKFCNDNNRIYRNVRHLLQHCIVPRFDANACQTIQDEG